MRYEYTMKNLKKHIGFDLKENYTDKEVKEVLNRVLIVVDIEYKEKYDTLAKISNKQLDQIKELMDETLKDTLLNELKKEYEHRIEEQKHQTFMYKGLSSVFEHEFARIFNNLIHKSEELDAMEFKQYIDEELIPYMDNLRQ